MHLQIHNLTILSAPLPMLHFTHTHELSRLHNVMPRYVGGDVVEEGHGYDFVFITGGGPGCQMEREMIETDLIKVQGRGGLLGPLIGHFDLKLIFQDQTDPNNAIQICPKATFYRMTMEQFRQMSHISGQCRRSGGYKQG